MFKIDIAKLSFIVIWAAVGVTTLFYVFYRELFLSVGQMIMTMIPSVLFFVGMILFYLRDNKKTAVAKEKAEFHFSKEMHWVMATKHDFLTYLIPLIILFMPYAFGAQTDLKDIASAIVVYIALIYLKILYWGEI